MHRIVIALLLLATFPFQPLFASDPDTTITVDGKVLKPGDPLPSGPPGGTFGVMKSSTDEAEERSIQATTEQERLSEVGATSYRKKELSNGLIVDANGENFGSVDKISLRKSGADQIHQLRRILKSNTLLVGDVDDYEFEVLRFEEISEETNEELSKALGYTRIKIFFAQVINGIRLNSSTLIIVDDSVVSMDLYFADPNSSTFDKSAWFSQSRLLDIAKGVIESQYGPISIEKMERPTYRITTDEESSSFVVVFEIQYGTRIIRIDVSNGDVLENFGSISYQDGCEWIPNTTIYNHTNCADTTTFESIRPTAGLPPNGSIAILEIPGQ